MPPPKEFYRAFEDRYRGSRDLIKQRLQAYDPYLRLVQNLLPGCPALDLGCGRGEWLEVLNACGITAQGIDLDGGMLAACRELNLNTLKGDALAYIKNTQPESLALVSAFHLVEHIGFPALKELVTDALQALRPGGLLILETPNPENLNVGATTFFRDPTHDKPIPPELLSFLCEYNGFACVKILRLQTAPHLIDGAQPTLFDVLTGSSADYAVVAQKSHPDTQSPSIIEIPAAAGFSFHELCTAYSQKTEDRYERALRGVADQLREHATLQTADRGENQRLREELKTIRLQLGHQIDIQTARIQILDQEKGTRDAYIRQLEQKLYGASASKHAYRALLVLLGNPRYRRLTPKLRVKDYQKLNAAWHTHLYRMLLCIRYEGQVKWHTHGARAILSLWGHRRYRALRTPEGLSPEHHMQHILFSSDQADRKLLLPPDAETLLARIESKQK